MNLFTNRNYSLLQLALWNFVACVVFAATTRYIDAQTAKPADKFTDTGATVVAAAAPPCCVPTHEQSLQLQVYQLKAMFAQKALQEAQSNFQTTMKQLSDGCQQVRAENGWPDDVQCNMDTLEFSKTPQPAVKPSQPAPPKSETPKK